MRSRDVLGAANIEIYSEEFTLCQKAVDLKLNRGKD
jgi:hypothetical protein